MPRPRKHRPLEIEVEEKLCASVDELRKEMVDAWEGIELSEISCTPLEDLERGRVGFKLEADPRKSLEIPGFELTLWVDRSLCTGPWGRALLTPEGRTFVATHECQGWYWNQDSPQDIVDGVVIFDP